METAIIEMRLEDDEVIIVGVNTAVNPKTGRESTLISYLMNFENWKQERASRNEGLQALTEYTAMDCSGLEIGSKVKFIYRKGFQNKAELAGYTIVD